MSVRQIVVIFIGQRSMKSYENKCLGILPVYLEEPIGYPAQPGLIRPSYCLFIRMGLQIRY